jgi:hypothetical protein
MKTFKNMSPPTINRAFRTLPTYRRLGMQGLQIHTHTHSHTSSHTLTQTTHSHTNYTLSHILTHIHSHKYTHTHTLTHIHSHTYTHTHTLTHIHSHTHTHLLFEFTFVLQTSVFVSDPSLILEVKQKSLMLE